MMMQNSDDNLFTELLSDYVAPVRDDGFSDAVLKAASAEGRKIERVRRFSIYGASFVGGIIAAIQIPMLVSLVSKINIAVPAIPKASSLPISQWSFLCIIVLGFVLWAALDRKASDIF